jgi:hypothetical protein
VDVRRLRDVGKLLEELGAAVEHDARVELVPGVDRARLEASTSATVATADCRPGSAGRAALFRRDLAERRFDVVPLAVQLVEHGRRNVVALVDELHAVDDELVILGLLFGD